MAITSGGNVGIGTTAPTDRLDVVGSIHVDFGNANIGGVADSLVFGDGSSFEAIGSNRNPGTNRWGLDFYTAGARRMMITNSGAVYIGTTLVIDTSGNVGIGRTPTSNRLEVQGDACKTSGGSTWLVCSDRRIKTEIETIENALDTIDALRLVEYRYTPDYLAQNPGTEDKVYYNVIAQEYAEVFPAYVKARADDGILQVDTHPALMHAIAAVQELHQIVAAKDEAIATLEERLARLEASVTALSDSK